MPTENERNLKKFELFIPLPGKKIEELKTRSIIDTLTIQNVQELKEKTNIDLIFSFRFLDRETEAFNLGKVCSEWFISLLEVLKEISILSWVQLRQMETHYHVHPQDWKKTNYKYELFDKKTMLQLECVQFGLNKSKGRVHGFRIDNVFYIYWLDPFHNMSDSLGYGRQQLYTRPNSCFEKLNLEIAKLKEENGKLQKENHQCEVDNEALLQEIIEKEEIIKALKHN